jgi:hypothetical protein
MDLLMCEEDREDIFALFASDPKYYLDLFKNYVKTKEGFDINEQSYLDDSKKYFDCYVYRCDGSFICYTCDAIKEESPEEISYKCSKNGYWVVVEDGVQI